MQWQPALLCWPPSRAVLWSIGETKIRQFKRRFWICEIVRVARGADAHPDEQPREFSRTALYQTVLLPSGSSDGTYDVRIAGL
ncbi:MAG: hypothetical protein DMG49_24675 [Acidobacteria bacterium]|nr:MAG: hypothetical protein DMG49_24675 [Acidobacteriota bacterium]